MATAVHYVNPDKPPELWINEVDVAATQAWALADEPNRVGRALYERAGGQPAAQPAIMYEFPLDQP